MDEWEDSALTKEEIDARIQRKVDAIIKRERAMAYAYCHQVLFLSKLAYGIGWIVLYLANICLG